MIIKGLLGLMYFCIGCEVTTKLFHEEVDPVFFKKLAQAQLGLLIFTDVLRTIYLIIVNRLNRSNLHFRHNIYNFDMRNDTY